MGVWVQQRAPQGEGFPPNFLVKLQSQAFPLFVVDIQVFAQIVFKLAVVHCTCRIEWLCLHVLLCFKVYEAWEAEEVEELCVILWVVNVVDEFCGEFCIL